MELKDSKRTEKENGAANPRATHKNRFALSCRLWFDFFARAARWQLDGPRAVDELVFRGMLLILSLSPPLLLTSSGTAVPASVATSFVYFHSIATGLSVRLAPTSLRLFRVT